MILLQASHITKQFDGHEVLLDASVVIQEGDRIALIGANGSGKSTLLRIIVGELTADSGDISLIRSASIGYVAQFIVEDEHDTVFRYVAKSFDHIRLMEQKMREFEISMAQPEIYGDTRKFNDLSTQYDLVQQEFTNLNGYAVETRIRRVLAGLRFPKEMHDLPVTALSGGQKTRLALARLLAVEPTLLILDEPTNYLDTDTLTWLEDYLVAYAGAVLMVSHDRYFLDKIAHTVYEMEKGQTTRYTGNYTAYVEEKANRFEEDTKRYEAQQQEIERLETFVQKNIVRATTTKRAQSRRKLLDKMVRLSSPTVSTAKLAVRFVAGRQSGKDLLRIANLQFGYPDKAMPGPLNLYVARGQRIALVGPNGIGKTTLLKTLVGQLPRLAGDVKWGTHADIGYYDQEQTGLDDSKTVLSQIWDEFPGFDITTIRTALGRFLFRGEDVTQPVSGLSGGERSRLSLCRLMLKRSNVLVLDEPTNHLDLMSKEVLEDSLQDYDGTLLFVSHDRYFIDALATHVVLLDESGFTTYIGNFTEYQMKRRDEQRWADEENEQKERRVQTSALPPQSDALSAAFTGSAMAHRSGGNGSGKRHIRSADLRKLRNRVDEFETAIATVEEQLNQLGSRMIAASVAQEFTELHAHQREHDALTQQHARLLADWEVVAAELEALETPEE